MKERIKAKEYTWKCMGIERRQKNVRGNGWEIEKRHPYLRLLKKKSRSYINN